MARIEDIQRVPNYRPKKFQASELKRAGVTIIDKSRPRLQCDQCGHIWTPKILHNRLTEDVRLARGYWICPENNCNKPE